MDEFSKNVVSTRTNPPPRDPASDTRDPLTILSSQIQLHSDYYSFEFSLLVNYKSSERDALLKGIPNPSNEADALTRVFYFPFRQDSSDKSSRSASTDSWPLYASRSKWGPSFRKTPSWTH